MRSLLLVMVMALPAGAQRALPRDTSAVTTMVDSAAVRWMRDTVTKDLAGRPGMTVREPRFLADTAWFTAARTETFPPDRIYVFTVEYRFERRAGAWVLTPWRRLGHSHGVLAKP